MSDITTVRISYKNKEESIDAGFDKSLKEFFAAFGLVMTDTGYDIVEQERDLVFRKQEKEVVNEKHNSIFRKQECLICGTALFKSNADGPLLRYCTQCYSAKLKKARKAHDQIYKKPHEEVEDATE